MDSIYVKYKSGKHLEVNNLICVNWCGDQLVIVYMGFMDILKTELIDGIEIESYTVTRG